jgi:hypothetical protein
MERRRTGRRIAIALAWIVVLAGCGEGPPPAEPPPRDIGGPWQAEPFAIDQGLLPAAVAACRKNLGMPAAPMPPLAVVDARGANVLQLLFVGRSEMDECRVRRVNGGFMSEGGGGSSGGDQGAPPAMVAIVDSLGTMSAAGAQQSDISTAVGRVGPGVSGVDLLFKSGMRIRASSANGWFVAWWPTGETDVRALALGPDGRASGDPPLEASPPP